MRRVRCGGGGILLVLLFCGYAVGDDALVRGKPHGAGDEAPRGNRGVVKVYVVDREPVGVDVVLVVGEPGDPFESVYELVES